MQWLSAGQHKAHSLILYCSNASTNYTLFFRILLHIIPLTFSSKCRSAKERPTSCYCLNKPLISLFWQKSDGLNRRNYWLQLFGPVFMVYLYWCEQSVCLFIFVWVCAFVTRSEDVNKTVCSFHLIGKAVVQMEFYRLQHNHTFFSLTINIWLLPERN